MTVRDERAAGTAAMAVLALACLAAAWALPWFEYDHSSGRQTPPEAAYNQGEDGVVREHLVFYAGHREGNVEPSDAALADGLAVALPLAVLAAALCLLAVAMGETPAVHRWVTRRVALGLVVAAFAIALAAALVAWVGLPRTLAGLGVDSQFTARLDEPDGYTSSTMGLGWYALAAALVPILGAALFKFQAGLVDLDAVASLLRKREDA